MQRIFHIDLNFAMLRKSTLLRLLEFVAQSGYNAILWEVEDKIQWETCPECVHPDAFSKAEFSEILEYSRKLNLEPIPLLQTLGHAEYVLNHEEYESIRENGCHDSYCIGHVGVLNLLQNWIQEYIDLFGDIRDFHLGGDEAWSFGTCPECAGKIKMFGKLGYAMTHYAALADRLIRQGIRPNMWADLFLQHPDEVKMHLPLLKRFRIWDWQYANKWGSTFESTTTLMNAGLNVVLCSAARSWGDKVWLPAPFHMDNVAATAHQAKSLNLSAYCTTSWMIRLIYHAMQLQFIKAAPLCEDADDAQKRADAYRAASGFQTQEQSDAFYRAIALAATDFPLSMANQFGLCWNSRKDHEIPPQGWLADKLQKLYADGIPQEDLDVAESKLNEAKSLFEQLQRTDSIRMDMWLEALSLQLKHLQLVRAIAQHDSEGGNALLLEIKKMARQWFHRYLTDQSTEEVLLSMFKPVSDYFAGL